MIGKYGCIWIKKDVNRKENVQIDNEIYIGMHRNIGYGKVGVYNKKD